MNQKILLEAGMPECSGDTFASGEGIEDRLFIQPAVLFQTDEIDGLMAKINLGKDARHEGIMNVLLKMYTSASSLYPIRVKAGKEPGVIDQPCLCIFGTAIPKHYYEALSLKMLTNGFFARMLILETGKRGEGQDAVVRDLPSSVRTTPQWWSEFSPGEKRGNLAGWHPIPKVVEHTAEAGSILRCFASRPTASIPPPRKSSTRQRWRSGAGKRKGSSPGVGLRLQREPCRSGNHARRCALGLPVRRTPDSTDVVHGGRKRERERIRRSLQETDHHAAEVARQAWRCLDAVLANQPQASVERTRT